MACSVLNVSWLGVISSCIYCWHLRMTQSIYWPSQEFTIFMDHLSFQLYCFWFILSYPVLWKVLSLKNQPIATNTGHPSQMIVKYMSIVHDFVQWFLFLKTTASKLLSFQRFHNKVFIISFRNFVVYLIN